jgi:hypothetical protein
MDEKLNPAATKTTEWNQWMMMIINKRNAAICDENLPFESAMTWGVYESLQCAAVFTFPQNQGSFHTVDELVTEAQNGIASYFIFTKLT